MTTLKGLIEKFGNTLTDIRLIEEWFIRNNQEAEGLELVSRLAQSRLNKVEHKYDYARNDGEMYKVLRLLCEKIAKNRTQDISGGTLRDISPVEMYEFYFRVR